MAKVKLGMRGLTTLQKLQKAKSVAEKVAQSARTDHARIPLAELLKAVNLLDKAITMAEFGDKRAIAARRLCEKELEKALRNMALAIEQNALGNPERITACGFEVRSSNNQSKPLEAPENLQAKRGEQEGCILLRWQAVPNSKSYLVQTSTQAPDKNTTWQTSGFSTRSRCSIDALKPGTVHWFRVLAIGAKGIGPPSPTVSIMAA